MSICAHQGPLERFDLNMLAQAARQRDVSFVLTGCSNE